MQFDHPDFIYLIALTDLWHASPKIQRHLLERLGNAKNIFSAKPNTLTALGCSPALVDELGQKASVQKYEKRVAVLAQKNIQVLCESDADYPQRLMHIDQAPILLFCKGNVALLNQACMLAVVGSRKMTAYGKQVVHDWMPEFVKQQVVITSGMALGVDAESHLACVQNGGMTLAVQAQGVDKGYPHGNHKVYEQILANKGLVVSEFSWIEDRLVDKYYFPRRNRLLSGMSDGVLVVEAYEKSGALITADFALEQNREVFALPGNLQQIASRGCNQLIQQGAKLVTKPGDILEELGQGIEFTSGGQTQLKLELPVFESDLEQVLYQHCQKGAQSLDDLTLQTQKPFTEIAVAVSKMQLKGYVKELDGKRFGV